MVGEGEAKHAVTQYYHRCVVALLLGEQEEVVLGFESLRTREHRHAAGQHSADCDEGEETAAIRLVGRLRATYGNWLDVIADGLYSNGPFLSELEKLRFGAVIVIKKETDEPLREALQLWAGKPRPRSWGIERRTNSSSFGTAKIFRPWAPSRGPFASPGPSSTHSPTTMTRIPSSGASSPSALQRASSHPVNSSKSCARAGTSRTPAFNQWTQHWLFEHVFVNDWGGMGGRLRFPLQRIQPLAALSLPTYLERVREF
jgi:hypothetical protein